MAYSIGPERWTLSAANGSPMPPAHFENTNEATARHAVLWPPSAVRVEPRRLYAFTADGHAYAMSMKN